ncbi:competence type IV pilus minor pilin ComGF [Peribacillus huizhouensis]|uniref:Competence protein ComGF n=1 Tax=Peribacillus huizhouensis TaxID=1501239 RepID=A0ABR6CM16_9BACI|nr:competence type IV pilus minor pilin ComGF [Peribacillus huizhouensis]MBA9025407.1 competence protein ComGF [Peribacillus huizhouensis]
MKRFVIQWNNRGFTLIEMLLSLSVFILIAAMIVQLYVVVGKEVQQDKRLNQMEWEIFLHQIKEELWRSSSQTIANGSIYLVVGEDIVSIEKYNHILRRRVNHTGHQIMLQNVSSFHCRVEGFKLIISVTDLIGDTYTKVLRPFVTSGFEHVQE